MAETITAEFLSRLLAESTGTNELASQSASAKIRKNTDYANGTSAGQVDLATSDDHAIVGAGSKSYTLSDGSLDNLLGTTATYVKVQALEIYNKSANDITVDGNFLGQTTDNIDVPAGGRITLEYGTNGRAVTGGSQDVITVNGTDVEYELLIIGRSA